MPSSHLILYHPLLLLPSIPPSIKIFSSESTLRMRWPKYWSFSFSIIPSKEIPGLISFRMDWLDLLAVQGTLKSLLQPHSSKASILRHSAFFTVQLSVRILLLELPSGEPIAESSQEKSIKSTLCPWGQDFSQQSSQDLSVSDDYAFSQVFLTASLILKTSYNARDAMTQILDEETKPINVRKNLNQRIKARRNVKDSQWGKQRKRETEKEESREVEDIFYLS